MGCLKLNIEYYESLRNSQISLIKCIPFPIVAKQSDIDFGTKDIFATSADNNYTYDDNTHNLSSENGNYTISSTILHSLILSKKINPNLTEYRNFKKVNLGYYGTRYYNANLGRWINRDPIGEQGGLNVYAFCNNDSINKWDYLGEDWKDVLWDYGFEYFAKPVGNVVKFIGDGIITGVEEAKLFSKLILKYGKTMAIAVKNFAATNMCPTITNVANNDDVVCHCGIVGIADNFNGVIPPPLGPAIELTDCGCNILTTLNNACQSGLSFKTLAQALLTFADCTSLIGGTVMLAGIGSLIEPAGGQAIAVLGPTLGDAVMDTAIYGIQNSINQDSGSPLPIDAMKACCRTIGVGCNNENVNCECDRVGD